MSEQNIHIQKLKKGNKILLETKECVFDLEIISSSHAVAMITGGKRFLKPTEIKIIGAFGRHNIEDDDSLLFEKQIERNVGIEIQYNDKDNITSNFITSPVLSAKIYGEGWNFEMWTDNDKNKKLESSLEEAKARIRIQTTPKDGDSNENTVS